jgi:ABC-type nitrate/sulfonate/bicarbonate transport system substrate-binding protein
MNKIHQSRGPLRSGRLIMALGGASVTMTVALSVTSVAGASSASQGTNTKPETTSLNVPTEASSAAEGPQVFAAAAGYDQKYGLTVSTPISDSGTVLSEFTAGAVKIDSVGQLQAAALFATGYPVQVVACTVSRLPFHMYAQTSITSIKDLVGKDIGTTALNSGHELAEEIWLKNNGVNPSQVKFVPLGSVPDILAALQSGSIAAGGLSYPAWASAKTNRKLHMLGLAPIAASPYVVNAQWAKDNANTIVAYLEGSVEGFYAYQTDKKAALPVLAKFLNLSLSNPTEAATVAQGYKTYLPPASAPISACPANYLADDLLPYVTAAQRAKIAGNENAFLTNSYIDTLISGGFYSKIQSKYGTLQGFALPSIAS